VINLRKLRWLDLLRYSDDQFVCPETVVQEIKKQKRNNNEILKLIQDGIITVSKIGRPIAFALLSNTDSEAISLGIENQSTVISEDGLLRESAIALGAPAIDIAGMLLGFYQEGRISQSECFSRLTTLFENRILSKSRYHQLLIAIRS